MDVDSLIPKIKIDSSENISADSIISFSELLKKIESGSSLAQAAGLTKNELEAIYTYGYVFFNQGKYCEALDIFALLLVFEQADRRFFIAAGTCLQMLKIYDKAIEYLGIANLFDPTDPAPAVQVAECLLSMKRFSEAYELLKTIQNEFESIPQYKEIVSKITAIISLAEN